MLTVEQIISEIQKSRQAPDDRRIYDTKSQKDEVAVMMGMMNDTSYKIDVYAGSSYQGIYCPAQSFRRMISNTISDMTGMTRLESENLVNSYEFKKPEAQEMVNFSKEYINTYLKTGRKLPLGGREKSNVSLKAKTVPAGFVQFPVKVGEDKEGHAICESKEAYVGEYETIKVYGPCPVWRKEEVNGKR
jgi:hypothetical protein